MGTRIGSSDRYPSTHVEAYATCCGAYQSIFESFIRGEISRQAAVDRWKYHTQRLDEDVARIAFEARHPAQPYGRRG